MERRAIVVEGIVQGVGFRPFVHALASRLGLGGLVRNRVGGVLIEVEGEAPALCDFLQELATRPPPLAHIDHMSWRPQAPRGDTRFAIEHSDEGPQGPVFISPDVATCDDCLRELFDPADRRFGYPFLNCTNCGPRLTIVTGAPYDRANTTMATFSMCAQCQAEYDDPANRRFHAQPICCPACGPRLEVVDASGRRLDDGAPVAYFAAALREGKIGALKGLGGYHLCCDARAGAVVAELRRRKQRYEKPLALMVRNLAAAEALCVIDPAERTLLLAPRRPIVLLRKRSQVAGPMAATMPQSDNLETCPTWPGTTVADDVAPGNPWLGIMLPYTPLHHLLLAHEAGLPLVMTSGNRSDEPIAYEDAEARARLADIADVFLVHDRPIHVRCDDSVTRCLVPAPHLTAALASRDMHTPPEELPLRRSRGYAPRAIDLPIPCTRPVLAVGGQMKGTFALGRGRHAFLSHHLGDLDHFDAYRAFVKDVELYEQLFGMKPEIIAHDLHPDYASTRYAHARAGGDVPLIGVQHHHAHVASCMAEHGLSDPVIGVAFDGTGYGTDGAVWGGEFLVGDCRSVRRVAHLRYVAMPGGDQAIREPWRMALAHLTDAGLEPELLRPRVSPERLRTVAQMLARGYNSPMTSSMGRLFDAVASLAGVRDRVSYEGQAAIELEWLAHKADPDEVYVARAAEPDLGARSASEGSESWADALLVGKGGGTEPALARRPEFDPQDAYPFAWIEAQDANAPTIVDTRPLIRSVAQDAALGIGATVIARRFHAALTEIIVTACKQVRAGTGIAAVALSGGVFTNTLLTRATEARLTHEGFEVYLQRLVPANDGGLSLGQIAVAAAQGA